MFKKRFFTALSGENGSPIIEQVVSIIVGLSIAVALITFGAVFLNFVGSGKSQITSLN